MKLLSHISFLFIFLTFSLKVFSIELQDNQRRKINISAGLSSSSLSVATLGSSTTSLSTSSVKMTALNLGVNYFAHRYISVSAEYIFALIVNTNSEIKGFNIGTKYYYLGNGYRQFTSLNGNTIESSPNLTPYMAIKFSNLSFQFSNNSINFNGYTIAKGFDYHFYDKYIVSAAIFYKNLSNTQLRNLTGSGISLKFGFSL